MLELGLDFISSTCIIISLLYFFGKLYGARLKLDFKQVIYIIIGAIIQVLLNLYVQNAISTIITIIYMYYMYKWIYKCTSEESKNYSVIIWILSLLVDIFIMSMVNITGLINNSSINLKLLKGIGSIIMAILLYLISKSKMLKRVLLKIYKELQKINIKEKYIIWLLTIFLLIDFISSLHITKHILILLLFIGGLSILLISTLLLSLIYKIYILKETNSFLEKNDEINRKIITDYRMLKHNLESQLLGIKTIANKESIELLDSLIKEYNQSFYVKHDINSLPSGINGIVIEKLYDYKDIDFNIITEDCIKDNILNKLGPRNYNALCESLGIVLDNALYASSKSPEKMLYLKFEENKNYILFKISNSFAGCIDIEKFGTLNYTSKEKGHGLGLYSLFYKKKTDIKSIIKNNILTTEIKVKKISSNSIIKN